MRILSMDQATVKSGYCYWEDGKYVCSGVVDLSKSKLDTDERSFEMAKELWKIMKQYKPNVIILEDVQKQTSIAIVKTLAKLQGMLIGYAQAHGAEVKVLLPSVWRKALHFDQGPKVKRAELKQQSINYVKEHFGLEVTDDESDAVNLGFAAHKIFDFDNLWGE